MKKHFLILLLAVTPFFAAYSQVTIPNEVAAYFLEQNERAIQLEEIRLINAQKISNLESQLTVALRIQKTFKNDSEEYMLIIGTKNDEITFGEKQLILSKKETRRQYRQKVVVMGVGAGVIIGTVIGQPIVGGAVGGAVGFVSGLFKRIR
jgi:hypothetical protein